MTLKGLFRSNPAKILQLALLYIITGKLGLMLAVPPGYATVIWPPSGIALGMLIISGWRLYPGILLGSFILNCYIANAYIPGEGIIYSKILSAFVIAIGSTIQALAGRFLIARYIGLPLKLNNFTDIIKLLLLIGPIACVIAASIGVLSLNLSSVLPADKMWENWITWWIGDILGIIVFLPLVLVAPGKKSRISWRGNIIGALPIVSMLVILMPMGLTFYAWKIASELSYEKAVKEFSSLALEGEKVLQHKISSYSNALISGAGFMQGSENVSRDEWRKYAEAIDVRASYPGINGIGFITNVKQDNLADFTNKQKISFPNFEIHSQTQDSKNYIITYIEPAEINKEAIGFDISFEKNRFEAAEKARDSGKTTITKQIVLVQDKRKTPGFLLLHPLYKDNPAPDNIRERRETLKGWIYAPFIANNFLKDLSKQQGHKYNIRIYDGKFENPNDLIYSSGEFNNKHIPGFKVRKSLNIMQQEWLVIWESTHIYEKNAESNSPFLILLGGILFTSMFAIFLIVTTVRQAETVKIISGERRYIIPAFIFLTLSIGSYLLFATLKERERNYIKTIIDVEADKAELLIVSEIDTKLQALSRIAKRWQAAGGTSYTLWSDDVRNHIEQLPGLKAVEWVDSNYIVRWAEPKKGNEKAIGLNVIFDKKRENALKGAAEKDTPTLTEPLRLIQGYDAFIAYIPLHLDKKFDGFIAGIFAIKEFFENEITNNLLDNYKLQIMYDGKQYFSSEIDDALVNKNWGAHRLIDIYDRKWELYIAPTNSFIKNQQTFLPILVLFGGLLIAALSALMVRWVLLAKLRSIYLEESSEALKNSEERYGLVVSGMSVGLWDWNIETNELFWSSKFKEIIGIDGKEFVPHYDEFVGRLHPEDKDVVLETLLRHTQKLCPYDVEYRLRHEKGHYVWIHAYGQAMWDKNGQPIRMAGSANDITEKKLQRQALKASAEQMRLLVENTPAAVAMFDNNLNYLMTSKRWIQDYNLEERQIIGKNHCEIFPEILNIPKWLDIHKRALNGEVFEMQEESWIRETGEQEWVKWAIYPWLDNTGNVGGIVMFTEVITARKQAEEALRKSEETFRLAMEHAPVGMALVSIGGRWLNVNPALCELLGYTEEELLANDFQSITYPDDLEKDLNNIEQMLSGEIKSYEMEKRYYHSTGKLIWVLLNVSMVRNSKGQADYFVSQIQDITERKEIEKIKNEFISVVSHELRTPLTAIHGSIGLIIGALSKDIPDKIKKLLEISRNNSERLMMLINDILDIDKIAAGQMSFDIKSEYIADITQQTVVNNEPYAQKFNTEIVFQTFDRNIKVKIDSERYAQALSNLISNAVKFSPKGEKIIIKSEIVDNNIRILVQDFGAGIPQEFYSRIFNKFSQADSSKTRSKGGTGLGLHITKQIVEKMNGTINFQSELGRGTTFWIEFPIVKE